MSLFSNEYSNFLGTKTLELWHSDCEYIPSDVLICAMCTHVTMFRILKATKHTHISFKFFATICILRVRQKVLQVLAIFHTI